MLPATSSTSSSTAWPSPFKRLVQNFLGQRFPLQVELGGRFYKASALSVLHFEHVFLGGVFIRFFGGVEGVRISDVLTRFFEWELMDLGRFEPFFEIYESYLLVQDI